MPPRAKKAKKNIEIKFEGECTICIENFREDVGVLKCNHSFCFNCIESWSKTENSCPLCKIRFKCIDRYQVEENASTSSSSSSSSSSTVEASDKPAQPKRKKTKVPCRNKDQNDRGAATAFPQPAYHPAAMMVPHYGMLSLFMHSPWSDDNDSDFQPPTDDEDPDASFLDELIRDDEEEDDDGEGYGGHFFLPHNFYQRRTQPSFIDLVGDDDDVEVFMPRAAPRANNEIIDLTLGDDEQDAAPAAATGSSRSSSNGNVALEGFLDDEEEVVVDTVPVADAGHETRKRRRRDVSVSREV